MEVTYYTRTHTDYRTCTYMTLSYNRFKYVSRKKAWPVVDWGIHEPVIVNMFLICRVSDPRRYSEQSVFR